MNNSQPATCMSHTQLESFLNERLSETDESAFQQHLESCKRCQKEMENLAASQAMWDELREHRGAADNPDEETPAITSLVEHLVPSEDPKFLGRLGCYEVSGVIGQGSTGIVVKALDQRLNRFVAIKVLTPTLASNGPARRRFEREGRAVAAVSHEHVVPIYAVDEYRGLPYIVMQYIPGLSLLQRIEKSGALNTCEVVRIGMQVASALSAAHGQGIVHRDVKPANVLLHGSIDRALVTDFGLARVSDDATMTRSGTISGTPQYMSPEQAKGELTDERTDLFSLGSLMYAACTARAPFRAETVFGIIHRVCQQEPHPIREINPDISPWLCSFIQKLMLKDPGDRFASAKEVAELLGKELAHLQNPTASPEPKRAWLEASQPEPQPNTQIASNNTQASWLRNSVLLAITCVAAWMIWQGLQSSISGRPEVSPEKAAAQGLEGESKTNLQQNFDQQNASQISDNGLEPHSRRDSRLEDESNSVPISQTLVPAPPASLFASLTGLTPNESPIEAWTVDSSNKQGLTATYTQRLEQALSLDNNKRIHLSADMGIVEVRHTELEHASLVVLRRIEAGSEAEAKKIADYHQLNFADEDGLRVSVSLEEDFKKRGGEANFEQIMIGLAVPAGLDVEVDAKQGQISFRRVRGNLSATNESGDIYFNETSGNVWARGHGGEIVTAGCSGDADLMCTHGNVCVAGIEGRARLRCSNGNIYVGKNPGEVSAHATGGDVRIAAIENKTSAHVEVGDIVVQLQEAPKAKCRLSAATGDVSLEVPSESSIAFHALGQIDSSLDFIATASAGSTDAGAEQHWQSADLNDGDLEWEITAITGTVNVATSETSNSESGLGGSGNRYFSLGGSGSHTERVLASEAAIAKTTGVPRPGAMVAVQIEDGHNIDGYTLYLPESYTDDHSGYPVIVYLQGAYGVGGPIERLNDWGLPRLIRDESDLSTVRNQLLLDTFVVVSIHISGGQYDDHPQVIQEILNKVGKQYQIDRKRIYVTGLSRGGHASWNLVTKLPSTFAATVPIGGSASIQDYSAYSNTAVWVAHNKRDPVVDWSDANKSVEEIEGVTDTRFVRFDRAVPDSGELEETNYLITQPDIERHDAWTEVYTSSEFYEWLLRQVRD